MVGFSNEDRKAFLELNQEFNPGSESYIQSIQDAEIARIKAQIFGNKPEAIAPEDPTQVTQEQLTPEMKPAESKEDGSMLQAVGSFFKELPSQVAGGALDAINNALETAKDIGKGAGIPDYGLQLFDKEGNLDLGFFTPGEIEESGGRRAQLAPDVGEADTTAGGFARALTQFAVGFIPISKSLKAAGIAGAATRGLAGGAIADAVTSDPHQARLATLLNEVPVLQDIVPDYIADNNPDNESSWEGRIKNALEGLALGGASEALIKGSTRMIKAYKTASKAPKVAKTASQIIDEDVVADMADDAAEAMRSDKVIDMGPEEVLYKESNGKTYMNHNRIKTDKDIHNVIQNIADKTTQTGKMGLDKMAAASKTEYKQLSELLGRQVDRPFTASEAVAAREVMTSSAEELTRLAKIAADPMASPEDMFKFRRATEVHYNIQEVVLAGRRATARSLKSWDITSASSKSRTKQITELMETRGADSKKLANMINDVAKNGGNVSATVNKSLSGKFKDAYYQVWINGLLSSPSTHMANIMSNMATSAMAIPERYITAGYDAMRGAGGESLIQANARAAGFFNGVVDGFKLMKGTLKNEALEIGSKIDKPVDAISAAAWGKQPDSVMGKGLDYIGRAIGMPGWALEKGDLFFKGINYRMMLNEKAAGQALEEGLTGSAFKQRVMDLVKNPTEAMMDVSSDFARYQTFQNQTGKFAQSIGQAVGHVPGGRFVMPFVRTPANILSYGFERTPVAFAMGKVREAIKSGGSARAEALARMSAGSLLMGAVAPLALDGVVTGAGPADYRERAVLEQTGWQPYSIKIGDKYVSYDRLEPISTLIGYSADISSIMGQLGEDESGELVAAGLAAFSRNLTNKTFLSGITEFVDVVTSNSPNKWESFASRQLSGLIQPIYSSAIRKANYFDDNISRDYKADDVNGFLKSTFMRAQEQVPGLGKSAPPRRDIWGDEIHYLHGVAPALEALTPIKIKQDDPDPVNKIIASNRIPVSLPSRNMMGIKLTNAEYSEYSKYAGRLAKGRIDAAYNKGMLKGMTAGPDGQMALYIKRILTRSREIARRKLIMENPELKARIRANREEQQMKLRGE
jgi:hypothetical protein